MNVLYFFFVADFEVAMIVHVEIFLFNLVVYFFLLVFEFFVVCEKSFCCVHFLIFVWEGYFI